MMSETNPWDELVTETREPRSLDTRRTSEQRRSWVEPTMLPDPTPQDGWVFKWVRTTTRNLDDKTNVQKRLREGWEPVEASEHPEMLLDLSIKQRTGHVEIGGLILCKMPEEMVDQRRRHYAKLTRDQVESAENSVFRDNNEVMKKFLEKRHQRFGAR